MADKDLGEATIVYEDPDDGTSGLVLVAAGPNEARARARELADDLSESLSVERVSD